MHNSRWEIWALTISAVWVSVIGWLGNQLTPPPPIPPNQVQLFWSEPASTSDAESYSGTVELSLDHPVTEPFAIHYQAERGDWQGTWKRTIPLGVDKITLPFKLPSQFRDDEFVDEVVQLTLMPGEQYGIKDGQGLHQVTFLKRPRQAHLSTSSLRLVEGTVETLEFFWELDVTSISAKRSYELQCELSGDGIDQGFFSAGFKTVSLRLQEGNARSERVVLRRIKPLNGQKRHVNLMLKHPPGASRENQAELLLGTTELTIPCDPLPPKKFRLSAEPPVLAEGGQGKLRLSLSTGTILPGEKVPFSFSADGVKFGKVENDETGFVPQLTGQLDAEHPEVVVTIQASPDKIGLQQKREVAILATVESQSLSTKIQVTDATPVVVNVTPVDTEFLVAEGAESRKLTFELGDGVSVERALQIPLELREVDRQGFDLIQIPGVEPFAAGKNLRTGVLTIPAGGSRAELAVSAQRNSSDDDSDRTVALAFRSEPGWDFTPSSPKSLRLVVRDAPSDTGNLLVLMSANYLNSGEKQTRNLREDLKLLTELDLAGTGWTLVRKTVFVVDATGKILTAREVLDGAELKPFNNEPLEEFNALNAAQQELAKANTFIKLTCLIWASETETRLEDNVEPKTWSEDPVLLLWAGGLDGSSPPRERETDVLKPWLDRQIGASTLSAISRLQIQDTLTRPLSKALKKLGQP